jgi:hypothetical protein
LSNSESLGHACAIVSGMQIAMSIASERNARDFKNEKFSNVENSLRM